MKITIVGGGNMGGAIARGLVAGAFVKSRDITVSDINTELLATLKAFDKEIQISTDNATAVQEADVVVIAVKPWLLDRIAAGIAPRLSPRTLVISIVAGIDFAHLKTLFDGGNSLFRVIPNTAIAIGESMTVVASCDSTPQEEAIVKSLFDTMGKTLLIEERLMSAATALGSCGTAFALRYIRAAMEAGVEMGFYPQQACEIVSQTVIGAAQLLTHNNTHPETEIDKVTTPGGITIKGLNAMEANGFTAAVIQGHKAAR